MLNDTALNVILHCARLFYQNDYPIIGIENQNGGGKIILAQVFHQLLQVRIRDRMYFSGRKNDINKHDFENMIYGTIDVETCNQFNDIDDFMDGITDDYSTNTKNILHKRTKIFDFGTKEFKKWILSNRKVSGDDKSENRSDIFETAEVGQIVEGEVVRITDFGAFVDIGGIDALLPLSQISWRWVEHPSDILKVGDKIKVEIIVIDTDKKRISLSLKNLEKDPWLEAKDKIKDGDKLEGTITRIKHFGAFVEVFPCVEALLPNNELIEYQNHNNTILKVGDKIQTTILKFNPDDRRISLSITNE
jgi:ribosomal protein S1